MDPALVDKIYECCFEPEQWPSVLGGMAESAAARGAVMFIANAEAGIMRWLASDGIRDDMVNYVEGGWLLQDCRRDRLVAANHAGFLTDHDIFTETELDNDPTRCGYYRARGLGWVAITGVPLPTGDWFILSVEREHAGGAIDPGTVRRLDALRPHLGRTALMSARLQLERARTISATLAMIGLAALVFDDAGKILAANTHIETLSGFIQWRAFDRIRFSDARANKLLQAAIETLAIAGTGAVRSFALRDANDVAALVAHVIPIRGAARDIFTRCAGVLVLTPVGAPQAPPAELVQSLFDLTPAEAHLARSLVAGGTLDEIAATRAVSRNTVRTHMRGVLEKTGCRRQGEVIALLSGISVPQG